MSQHARETSRARACVECVFARMAARAFVCGAARGLRLRTCKSARFRPRVLPVAGRVSHRAFDFDSYDALVWVRSLVRQCVRGRLLRVPTHVWPQERLRARPRV